MRQWYLHGWKTPPAAPAEGLLKKIAEIETLKAELLSMESRLRNLANETSDTRLAARLDMGADHIERAVDRLQEKLDTRNLGGKDL